MQGSHRIILGVVSVLTAGLSVVLAGAVYSEEKPAGPANPHHAGPPAVKGNPAFDPTLPPRLGHVGRLLLQCQSDEGRPVLIYASAQDFDEGRQSFFLRQRNAAGADVLYPMHGHFLNAGDAGVFMIHDGKGVSNPSVDAVAIDQSVNMGLLFLRTTPEGLRAVANVHAEDESAPAGEKEIKEFSCRREKEPRRLSVDKDHVRATPNSGARPPSHWYRESDRKLLSCTAVAPTGVYRIEVLGASMWPGHLAFLLVHAPGTEAVGYNVHLLEGPGRLLVHAHSYPHRTRVAMMDTMEETETVVGGLLLRKTQNGYAGWIGLVSSAADPMNTSFSRDATLADYASLGHAVIPPLRVTCR